MASVGRNAPCPCGSGAKYKKCCLAKDEREAALRRMSSVAEWQPGVDYDVDELDDLSNSVLDLIKARRFDEALAVCRRLLTEYPDVADGLERSALVHAAMGDHATAAAFYRDTLAFITHPCRRDDYEGVEYYQKELRLQEELAARAAAERSSGGVGECAP